ncbi:hypothetical protein [Streptacidiphilus rugosus]|uniref:hypothetical protein n=1 Tax=Streptacidiphilus rugosus TaxID=405783 RepID=UPI0012F9F50A|nr:hypothetical protein [Streptacidiphilus rugosus]
MKHYFLIPLRISFAAASAAILAACATAINSSPPQLPAPIPSAPGNPYQPANFRAGEVAVRDDGTWTLPLDSYDKPANWQITGAAINSLAQQCMTRLGLSTPAAFKFSGPPAVPLAAIYGVLSMTRAQSTGYRVMPDGIPATVTSSAGTSQKAQEQVAAKAYFGDPQHHHAGCAGQAVDEIGMQKAYDAAGLVNSLRAQARSAASRDPRVQQVNTAWSSCMKAAGYAYPDPTVPPHDKSLLGRGLQTPPGAQLPPPSPAEKAAAVADVKCKRTVNYAITLALVNAAYQNLLIAQQFSDLQRGEQDWRSAVEAAQRIIPNGR